MKISKRFNKLMLLAALMSLASNGISAKELPLKKILLSTSGLANFELRGQVSADDTIEINASSKHIDDFLKSLVVFDSEGQVGELTLSGKEPLNDAFNKLPIQLDDLSSVKDLLNALQGVELNVKINGQEISGKLIKVEDYQITSEKGESITRNKVSLLTSDGIKQLNMENVEAIKFSSDKLQKDLTEALTSVFDYKKNDNKVLKLKVYGDKTRDVIVSYVLPAPLWKSAYRVVVDTTKDEGLLQGWAILENMSGIDWDNVDLSLISGNPVTYHQALYNSYYAYRPELPVKVSGNVLPRQDTGVVSKSAFGGSVSRAKMMSFDATAPTALSSLESASDGMMYKSSMEMAQSNNATTATESLSQVLFNFGMPVSLKAGHSMMVPFITQKYPMERMWIYQPDTNRDHPYSALKIKNNSQTAMPEGVLTLYQTSADMSNNYIGDAELPMLAKGEDKIISFALDTNTQITQEEKLNNNHKTSLKINKGVLQLLGKQRNETEYTIKAPQDEDRHIVIEHPIAYGNWEVVEPKEGVEKTATHYRITVDVPKGETKTVTVALEQVLQDQIIIADLNIDEFLGYTSEYADSNPNTKAAIEHVASLKTEVVTIEKAMANLSKEKESIYNDQKRLRSNLDSVPKDSELFKKYMNNLNTSENRLEEIEKELKSYETKKQAAKEKLNNYLANLVIE